MATIDERVFGFQQEMRAVEQILGQALGYPWYKDNPEAWPDATDADGVCVGEHTPYTLAKEAAMVILSLATQLRKEPSPRTVILPRAD